MSGAAPPSSAHPPTGTDPGAKPGLVHPGMGVLFIVVAACFLAWGVAADLTTPMVAGFKRIFDMSTFQASLVQLAYFGAYFLLAVPAAFLNERFGYKVGLLTGLGLAALGSFAFFPASKIMTFEAFLVALFAIAAGCSILETSANPYVLSLGPEETATRRLNLAQAFNPLGTNIGVLLAATLILPKLSDPVNMSSLTPEQLHEIRAAELGAVMAPYIGLGCLLVAIGIVIALNKAPQIVEEFPDAGDASTGRCSARCCAIAGTPSASSLSSSTSPARSARGRTSSSTSSRRWAGRSSSAATSCRSASSSSSSRASS